MHFSEYQDLAMRTRGVYPNKREQSLCALLGLSGESGEYIDLQKKVLYHNKPVNEEKQMDEMGDILWYLALECDAKGWNMDTIAGRNVEKLRARYPEGFNFQRANCPSRDDTSHARGSCSFCNPWLK